MEKGGGEEERAAHRPCSAHTHSLSSFKHNVLLGMEPFTVSTG